MSLVFFPNAKATQDKIASIKASFRAVARWTGEAGSAQAPENDARYMPVKLMRVVSTAPKQNDEDDTAHHTPDRKASA